MLEYGYRSEVPFGEGFRDAIPVMIHECRGIGNTDILETLKNTYLKGTEYQKDCQELIDELEEYGYIEDMAEDDWEVFFKSILGVIEQKTGKKIKYCLWLCNTPEDVIDSYSYGNYIIDYDDIDTYQVSSVVLSDLGRHGKLYGYEECPCNI